MSKSHAVPSLQESASLLERLRELLAPQKAERPVIRLSDLQRVLLENYEAAGLRSAKRAEQAIQRVIEHLGDIPVHSLGDRVSKHIAKRRKEGRSPATIRYEVVILKRACKLALERRMIDTVPWFPSIRVGDNARTKCPTEEEMARVLAELPHYLRNPALWASWTGCRREETFGLLWSEVDRERHVVTLSAKRCKNGESRAIPYGQIPSLVEMIDTLQARNDKRLPDRRSPYVFLGRFGLTRISDYRAGARIAWKNALRRAGVEWLCFHDLRRLAVSRLVRAGVPQVVTQRVIGHKTASMVSRYYRHSEADIARALGMSFEAQAAREQS